ncbi:MAG: MerR family DNA-binding protein [Planctomycetota bacterium]
MSALTIGKVARQAGVGVETVRFYEREGLIEEPPRRQSGYRQYDPAVVERLRFIRRAKELGFTLKEIKELLELRLDPSVTCGAVHQRAQEKIADIEARIAALKRMKQALARLTRACEREGGLEGCPIVRALQE